MRGFISGHQILFHWSVSFLCQYHTVLITVALKYDLKIRHDASGFVLSQSCFGCLVAFVVPYKFNGCF